MTKQNSDLSKKELDIMIQKLKDYMAYKKPLDTKIIENDRWYKGQHWDLIKSKNQHNEGFEPSTAFLFNALANKHADAMESYPYPNILEREENDAEEATALAMLIPFILQVNNFRQTYSKGWWYKLKNGVCAYGIFFNPEKENGLGDIDIQRLDIPNLFWEPGVEDIQKSKFFYITNLLDNDYIETLYPHAKDHLGSATQINYKSYLGEERYDLFNKSLVVDCYYKKTLPGGKTVVHMTKFVNDFMLESSETNRHTKGTGLYDHGMYPIVFDVMFPCDGTPAGFGLIDLAKNPQAYIDKLDNLISQNALISGKVRWLIKDNGGINEQELLDVSKDVIHVAGSVNDDNLREFQARSLDPYIIQHRMNKISELKEVVGNRDFTQGSTTGGVTAYGAIVALQEAGNKLSRDMINESFEAYQQIIYMVIELVRQFFDEERRFRIIGDNGKPKYISYSNKNLKPQKIEFDMIGKRVPPQKTKEMRKAEAIYKKPIFDIDVRPEKATPFSRISQNQLALDLYKLGFFNPQRTSEALCAIDIMDIEGKEKIRQLLIRNDQTSELIAEMQTQIEELSQSASSLQGPTPGDRPETVQEDTRTSTDALSGLLSGLTK